MPKLSGRAPYRPTWRQSRGRYEAALPSLGSVMARCSYAAVRNPAGNKYCAMYYRPIGCEHSERRIL